MAQNRRSELEARASSSDEEEQEGSSEEQEGSESESEAEEDKTSPPTPPVPKKPSASKKPEAHQTPSVHRSSSSDDSGSESESESDSQPEITRRADPNIKPIASKPMEDPPKSTKKPRSKPSVPASPAASKSGAGAKRPVESEAKDLKRVKRKLSDVDAEADGAKKTAGDDPKKQLFQRLWSEDDEIAILKGMIEYTTKKGADPVADMSAFHDFIKKALHIDVTKTQLSDKVRRLKKKYENNASKEMKGKDRTFSKAHEQKAYDLSKKIWGKDSNSVGIGSPNPKVNGNAKKNQNQRTIKSPASTKVDTLSPRDVQKQVPNVQKDEPMREVEHNAAPFWPVQFSKSIGDQSMEEKIMRDGLEWIAEPKRVELGEKWKELQVQEVELYLKRVELIREQTKLVLEAIKSSEH